MKQILRRLPFHNTETAAAVGDQQVAVRPYQIVVWVSLAAHTEATLKLDTPRFPAILDTGTNHNFAIQEEQLSLWTNIGLDTILPLKEVRLGVLALPLLALNVWLHRNKPGERDAFAKGSPFCLEAPEGIIVYPRGVPTAARLPVLGLRALARSGLRLSIDGKARTVSLTT